MSGNRQERLAALVEERKQVIEDEEHGGKKRSKGEKGGAGLQVDAEDMVQKEAQRLEVMKRRQERELGQMVAYELMRKEMQVCCITSAGSETSNAAWRGAIMVD